MRCVLDVGVWARGGRRKQGRMREKLLGIDEFTTWDNSVLRRVCEIFTVVLGAGAMDMMGCFYATFQSL